jgi:hypothetical protein
MKPRKAPHPKTIHADRVSTSAKAAPATNDPGTRRPRPTGPTTSSQTGSLIGRAAGTEPVVEER